MRKTCCVTLFLLAGILALSSRALAREAVVTTKDGRQLSGEIVSDNDAGVTLKISGILTPVPRAEVQGVEYKKSVEEQYKEKRDQIPDNNLEDRYKLASWLFEQKAFPLAKRELDDLAVRFPDDSRVKLLLRLVEQNLKLSAAPAKETVAKPKATTVAPKASEVRTVTGEPKSSADGRLSDEQVNLIKVMEVDPTAQPRVIVPADVVEALLKNHASDEAVPKGRDAQAAFRSAKGYQQLDVIFKARARELYSKVKVVDDPKPLQVFKTSIHRSYVLSYCGTANCHGGEKGGDFIVFANLPETDRTAYTNFYILHQAQDAQGYLIDLSKPELSALLQYGLPRNAATIPHPDVPGWRPSFAGLNDPRYQTLLNWVVSLGTIRQNYPFSYSPPHKASTPATQPAAKGS